MAKQTQPTPAPPPPRTAEAKPAATPAERVGKTTAPKPRRDVGLAWLVLLGLLVVAALPLLIDIERPAAWSQREAYAAAISAETHQRKTPINDQQTSLDAWTPVYQGATRWALPPGGVWLHQVMYAALPIDNAGPDADVRHLLLVRARLGSALMALLFVAAVYWAGHSIGGVITGSLSAAAAMTMPLLIGFGRHATADAAALAWSTLSIAGALWAMRPLRAAPSLLRQLIGWVVSGTALGLATLTAGPAAVPATLLCTIVMAMICPRRVGHIMGLLASIAIAALLLTPWALHVHDHNPHVWQQWIDELTPDYAQIGLVQTISRAGWRLSLAASFAGLWLVWLITAAAQPFSTSTGKARRRMMLGWAWLVTASALIALAPGQTRLMTLLIGIAPASLAIGQVLHQFHDLSGEGRHARLWVVCRWIATALMLALAIGLPTLGYLINHQPDAVNFLPTLQRPLLATMHWGFYAGAAAALLLATALAVRFALGHHPGRTAACLALWLMCLYTLAAIPIARGPLLSTPATPPTSEPPRAASPI